MSPTVLLPQLMKALKADKGRDVNRTLVLVGVIWCIVRLEGIAGRVAVIEAAHRPAAHAASVTTNSVASVGPRWPEQAAVAFQ